MMTAAQNIEEIRNYLAESLPDARRRFEEILVQAQSAGDVDRVKDLVEAAEPLLNEQPPYLEQWRTFALGYLALVERNQPERAAAYMESLRRQAKSLEPDLLGRVLNSLVIIYGSNEQWDRAMRYSRECVAFYEREEDDWGLGKALYNLSIMHYKAQDYRAAVDCAARGIALLDKNPHDKAWQTDLGNALNELGLALMALDRLSEAREALEKSLNIDIHWGNLRGQGISHTNLGRIYRRLGDIEQAEIHYNRARYISQEAKNQHEMAEAVYGLGSLMLDKQQLDKAGQYFDEALTLAQATNNHNIVTAAFLRRADLQDKLGDKSAALEENRQAVETVESLRANIATPETRIRLQGNRIEAYEKMVMRLYETASTSGYKEAFRYAEMAKSRAFIEMLSGPPPPSPESVPPELSAQEARLQQWLRELYEDSNADQTRVATLETALNQLRQHIRFQNAEFESLQTVAPLSLDKVMARLPADGALLEYFTAGEAIFAFVITSGDIEMTRIPLTLKELARAFSRSQGALGPLKNLERGPDYRLRQPWILKQLAQKLLKPLGEQVWSASTLCIVPHNLLHYIPFHALYRDTGFGQQYFLGDEENPRKIIYAPSATTLFEYSQQKPRSLQTGCLAFGYNNRNLGLTQSEMGAKRIAQLVGGQSRTGAAATRAALFEQGADYRYLHFFCHAWFNPTWPMASGLSLADGTLDAAGILHKLRLKAELVALSACETGRSRILQGDELVGLVRAFLYAGTPSVLVSQWVVDELSTRLLMERFYRELAGHSQENEAGLKAQALSRAQSFIKNLTFDELKQILSDDGADSNILDRQLNYLAASAGYNSAKNLRGDEPLLAHPYYWAPFFLVGDRLSGAGINS